MIAAARRKNVDTRFDDRIVGLPVRHALGDPAASAGRYSSQPTSIRLPPPWGSVPVALEQQQAALGAGGEEASAAGFLHQMFEILGRLEAEQRQAKAVLPAGFSMASAHSVAAVLGENGDDLVRES